MSHFVGDSTSDISQISISDICGLWEVIRISKENSIIYPWIKDRFKYSFQPEMVFLCLQDGQISHGTWELSKKTFQTQRRFWVILNETFKYAIIAIDDDEMILSDNKYEYLLYRKL